MTRSLYFFSSDRFEICDQITYLDSQVQNSGFIVAVSLCWTILYKVWWGGGAGADPGFRRGGFVQEFRLENRSYPDVHDFSLRMQVIIAND